MSDKTWSPENAIPAVGDTVAIVHDEELEQREARVRKHVQDMIKAVATESLVCWIVMLQNDVKELQAQVRKLGHEPDVG